MASEVALYKRPKPQIRITDDNPASAPFKFRTYRVSERRVQVRNNGSFAARGIRMENGGAKGGLGHTYPMLRCLTGASCSVNNSVLEPKVSGAVRSTHSNSVFSNNVILKSTSAMWLTGSCKLLHNLVVGGGVGFSVDLGQGENHDPMTSSVAAFVLGDDGASMTIIGNSIAGWTNGGQPAFSSHGFAIPRERFRGNSAHDVSMGWAIKGSVTQPLQDLTFWGVDSIAIYGYSASDQPVISNVRIADSAIGLWWMSMVRTYREPVPR